jgi:nickel-type superoxide dismutase maturation protease
MRPWTVMRVRGRSMVPTLHDGDLLLVRRRAKARVGALAVVRLPAPGPVAVKRLVHEEPAGWWVERDNPREGVDSWSLGTIPAKDVVGTVTLRLWPRPSRLRQFPQGR